MSISSEISRIQSAKTALATSIENKGVTVPAATTLDGYAALVDSIQTGGGGGYTMDEFVNGSIANVTLTSAVTTIPSYKFYYWTGLQTINMGNGVTTIGQYVFRHCTALTSVVFSTALTVINDYAFFECSSLATVDLSSTALVRIRQRAFASCTSLTYVDLPSTLTSMQYGNTFNGCTNLSTVIVRSTNCAISTSEFTNTAITSGNGKIYVPYGYGETYKAKSGWSTYANYIYELDANGNIPT